MSGWIKCSDRLPDLDDDGYSEPVLAINKIGNIQVVSFYSDEGWVFVMKLRTGNHFQHCRKIYN